MEIVRITFASPGAISILARMATFRFRRLRRPVRSPWLPRLLLAGGLLTAWSGAAQLLPPGHRPLPPGVHLLKASKVIPRPGEEIINGRVLIRDGRIAAVGSGLAIPADARVWELTNATIYAGFLDLHVPVGGKTVDSSGTQLVAEQPHDLTAGGINFFGVPGGERDPGAAGPGSELAVIRSEHRVAPTLAPAANDLKALRELGFTAANFVPGEGVLRGSSALALLGDTSPNRAVLRADVFQHAAFDAEASPDGTAYPRSLMGVIAAIRQTLLDAQHYTALAAANPPRRDPVLGFSEAVEALRPAINRRQPVVFEPGSVLMADRATRLAGEFNLDFLLLASGQEWRRPDLMAATGARFIVPLSFPELPKMPEESDWDQVELDQLRAWDWAAENPALLRSNRLEIALTTFALGDKKRFRKNLRLALDRGLSEADALAALTTRPAEWSGVADQLGTIAPGRLANLTVVRGSYFDPEAQVSEVWIEGVHYPLTDPAAKPPGPVKKEEDKKSAEPPAARVARSPLEERGPILAPPAVLFRNATIWTSGPEGILHGQDLLLAGSKVAGVGETGTVRLNAPDQLLEVDATGLHLTAGLIDAHNHSYILGSVNEGTLPSTAMVRIGDVVNSESPQIYEQLAGGLTAASLLHGSANPIGGQNAVVKLRWGAGPEAMKIADAPPGIKFALGENVKQSNWGENRRSRFPQTRMGVPVFMANRFTAAQQYLEAWRRFAAGQGPQPRRDLELEALGEIITGTRLIHCHSYRQDEIVAFLRVMESFGVRVGTLQHILEGYKVADEIAAHGAGASAFADWWAFKYEVIDAIPYAGAIMHDRGVLVSFNSDSSDHARRMNREAAKAVKYGGVPEADALNFVTINPAKQLGIGHRTGSLEVGKDADIAVWSGHPFAPETVCLQTWIDGQKYFDRALEPERITRLRAERDALLARAKKTSDTKKDEPAGEAKKSEAARALFFRQALENSRHFQYSCCEAHDALNLKP
jgi:imidazolonepropionase-like amidohydrolase